MILKSLTISPSLSPFIAMALYVRKDVGDIAQFNLVPRFFSAWAFILENTDTTEMNFGNGTKHTLQPYKIYSGGSGYVPVEFKILGKIEWIFVLPYPHCTGIFWREDADHFANKLYCISDIGQPLRILNDQVNTTESLTMKWNFIQKHLEKRLSIPSKNQSYVSNALKLMFNHSGVVTINDVARYSCTCDRNLRDSFKQHVGYSPKKFASMIRFNALIKQILSQTQPKTLLENSLEYNYYDLSHLNKDFMRFIGVGVEEFMKQEQDVNRLILP